MVPEDASSSDWETLDGHGLLSRAEREYLATGETGSYTEPNLKKQIETKIKALPTEFEAFETDIQLLSQEPGYLTDEDGDIDPEKLKEEPAGHFLTPERWETGWWSLLGINDGPPDSMAEMYREFMYSPLDSDHPESAPTTLGRRVGEMVSDLMLFPPLPFEEGSEAAIRRQLVWGFVQGVYLSPLLQGPYSDERPELIEELINDLNEWAHQRHRILAEGARREFSPTADAVNAPIDIYTRVSELLNAREGTTEWLIEQTAIRLVDEYQREQDVAVPEENEERRKPVEEFVTESRVDSHIEAAKLDEKQELREMLSVDAQAVREKQKRGISGFDVFQIIFETPKPSSAEIARQLGSESALKGWVTRIARDFAGVKLEKTEDKTWEDRPLVSGDSDGWQLTAYGRALGYYLDEQDDSKPPMKGQPDDVLEAALDEVELGE